MTSFEKTRFVISLLVSILMASAVASAADVSLNRQGDDVVIAANVQADFAGSEATITVPDVSTIEISVPGADFSVDGKRQLFRFEDALVSTLSVSRSTNSGVLRFNVADKSAARLADVIQVARSASGAGAVIVTVPTILDAPGSASGDASGGVFGAATGGSKTVSIAAVASDVKSDSTVSAPVSAAPSSAAPAAVAQASAAPAAPIGAAAVTAEAAQKDTRPESEIPVFVPATDVKKTAGAGLERLVITLFVVCALLGAALFGLKRWAARRGKNAMSPTKIQILTQHHLGPKKSLAIIQVAGEAILIGITDQNISMLKTLALIDDEVPGLVPKNFSDELDREDGDSRSRDEQQLADEGFETDNFAMRGLSEVRDMVSTRFGSRSARKDI